MGVAWALRQAGHAVSGFDVAIDSCVPYGAGLSSSAALEASVAVALDAVFGLGLAASDEGRATLAALCVRAENEIAGAPTGGMDQAASLRSQDGHALLLDCLDGSVRHVPFDLAAHDLALLVVDTRAEHALVDGQYAARRASCEAAAARLGVGDAARGLRRPPRAGVGPGQARRRGPGAPRPARGQRDRPRRPGSSRCSTPGEVGLVGTLMNASHASLRDDYEVSCRELDLVVDTARAAGAVGARMTGGGFGGSAIALVAADEVDRVAQAVADAFADAGSAGTGVPGGDGAGPAA